MSGRARAAGLVGGLALGLGMSSPALGQNALGTGQSLDPRLDARGPQALWGGSVPGQSVQGSGRLLDNSLYAGSRYNDAGISRDPMREFAFRRSIVTGNAAGGLSFRGDVGYLDARAFRADLGSNDLFAFRRDSLYSGLVGQGIRGTEALQYQMALTTGSTPPPNLVGSIVVPRSFTLEPVSVMTAGRIDTSAQLHRPDPADGAESGSLLGTLRSSGAYSTSMSLQPLIVNKLDTPDNAADIAITASPLRGVRLSPVPDESEDTREDLRADTSVPGTGFEAGGRVETAHDVVMRQLEEAASPSESGEETEAGQTWAERLEELRLNVIQGTEPGESGSDDEGAKPGELPKDLQDLERMGTFDAETIDLMRRAREPVKRLVTPGEGTQRDIFREHMEAGQRLLTRERFFDAEERFTRALAMRPGDVTAQVGRIHSQIGAGMYLSASTNLRVLMIQNPELIAMRFDETLLPGDERRERIMTALRTKIGIGGEAGSVREGDAQLRREAGLLLAYLGRQTGDRDAVRDGLSAIRKVNDEFEGDKNQATERRLLELLERVWLSPETDG